MCPADGHIPTLQAHSFSICTLRSKGYSHLFSQASRKVRSRTQARIQKILKQAIHFDENVIGIQFFLTVYSTGSRPENVT
jgi:hypothetical protein